MDRRTRVIVHLLLLCGFIVCIAGCHSDSRTDTTSVLPLAPVGTAQDDLPGDMDMDGQPGIRDVIVILRMVVGIIDPTNKADCDGDGEVGINDAIMVLRCIVGFDPWPIEPLIGHIVYANAQGVNVCRPDGVAANTISPEQSRHPRWSPGGLWIAVERGDPISIWRVRRDGVEALAVYNIAGSNCTHPRWSPDGISIACTIASGAESNIWIQSIVSGLAVPLTGAAGFDAKPTWSPSGLRLAYESTHDGSYDIWAINRDGTGATNLTDNRGSSHEPDWSPDGQRICYWENDIDTGNQDIWVMDADGSNTQQLTDGVMRDSVPKWSPDGTMICFQRSPNGTTFDIWVIGADGSNPLEVIFGNGGHDAEWSPDSKRLVFVSEMADDAEIFIVNVDGTGLRNISKNDFTDRHPHWTEH